MSTYSANQFFLQFTADRKLNCHAAVDEAVVLG